RLFIAAFGESPALRPAGIPAALLAVTENRRSQGESCPHHSNDAGKKSETREFSMRFIWIVSAETSPARSAPMASATGAGGRMVRRRDLHPETHGLSTPRNRPPPGRRGGDRLPTAPHQRRPRQPRLFSCLHTPPWRKGLSPKMGAPIGTRNHMVK